MKMIWQAGLLIALIGGVIFGVHTHGHRAGWNERELQAQSDAAAIRRAVLDEVADNFADAGRRDAQAFEREAAINQRHELRHAELKTHLARQAATPYQPKESSDAQDTEPNPGRPLLGQCVLDDTTVRMLDDARADRKSTPEDGGGAGATDEEGNATAATAPAITGGQFAENDLEVVRLYHQLAGDHDELVEWVQRQCLPPAAPGATAQ